jgi:hypothetical protein
MAYTAPTTEPTSLRAGDTWAWRREDLSDYPASTWTLKYYFRNASAKFDITASADGEAFAVSVAKATTATYAAGDYDWIAVVETVADRYQVDEGRVEVLPNLATNAVYDARTFARTMLDAVEAALLSKANLSQLDLVQAALADRSMQYDTAALLSLRKQFQSEVRREDAVRNGVDSSRLLVGFG